MLSTAYLDEFAKQLNEFFQGYGAQISSEVADLQYRVGYTKNKGISLLICFCTLTKQVGQELLEIEPECVLTQCKDGVILSYSVCSPDGSVFFSEVKKTLTSFEQENLVLCLQEVSDYFNGEYKRTVDYFLKS